MSPSSSPPSPSFFFTLTIFLAIGLAPFLSLSVQVVNTVWLKPQLKLGGVKQPTHTRSLWKIA